MKSNPAVWFEIYVRNLDRAKKFYESVLQGKLERLDSPGMDMWAASSSSEGNMFGLHSNR